MQDNGMWGYVCTSCDADLEDWPSDDKSMLQGSGRGRGRGPVREAGTGSVAAGWTTRTDTVKAWLSGRGHGRPTGSAVPWCGRDTWIRRGESLPDVF